MGTADKELLATKIANMRILDPYPLPAAVEKLLEEDEEVDEKTGEKVEKKDKKKKKEPVVAGKGVVRMANLSVIAGHAVNGVAEIHSEIVKDEVFNDFYQVGGVGA